MKKVLLAFIFALFICLPSLAKGDLLPSGTRLMEYSDYKKVKLDNIKSLKIIRYTEGGVTEKDVDDRVKINAIYNFLNKIILSDECKMGCTDNTTIYSFTLNDGTNVSVEFECDWLVIKGKNYNFYYPKSSQTKKRPFSKS